MKDIKIVKSITNRDCDSLTSYFREIYKYKPLTPEEELVLSREHSKESLDKLVLHNLRFVITVAKQYQGQGLSLEDLINEGNLGLIKAADKYDPERGFKFISYAVWWIRQSIIAAIYNDSRVIKSPTSFIVLYNKIKKTISEFSSEFNREPDISELAELLNMSEDKISEILNRYVNCTSLDNPISDSSETSTLVDVVENINASTPDLELEKISKSEQLKRIINSLSKRDSYIIKEYFGLFGSFPKTFEEIGKNMGLTGERVRQIKNFAIEKLKTRYGKQLYELLIE